MRETRTRTAAALSAFATACLAALVGAAALSLQLALPPAPLPADADPALFSAKRALAELEVFAQRPHAMGTAEHAAVRDHLLARLQALGLEVELERGLGISRKYASAGFTENIVARLPGSTKAKPILVAAHYDSVPSGPGAADDGASVAALLETLRALKAVAPLERDVVVLITDGEEAGLLGAEAFGAERMLARDAALVLNFEYRGNAGPFFMFETSVGNGQLVEALARAVREPRANSLMYEVYRHLPNDTVLTVLKRGGVPAMNFAAIDGHMAYHTRLDRPEQLDLRSLQHEGDILLALLAEFGHAPQDELRGGDRVYFDLPWVGLIHYSARWVWPLTALAVLGFGFLLVRLCRREAAQPWRILLGGFAFASSLALIALAAQALWRLLLWWRPEYAAQFQQTVYGAPSFLLAFLLFATAAFLALQRIALRWLRPLEWQAAALSIWLLLLLLTTAKLPGASFLFLWPLIITLLALQAYDRQRDLRLHFLLIALAALPTTLVFTPLVHMLYVGLTPQLVAVPLLFFLLLLGLVTPLLRHSFPSAPALLVPAAFGVVATVWGVQESAYDAAHPRQQNLQYVEDGNTGKAYWLSSDLSRDDWTASFFPGVSARRSMPQLFGAGPNEYWVAEAPSAELPGPAIEDFSEQAEGNARWLRFRLRSPRQAPILWLQTEGATVLASRIEGRPFTETPRTPWSISVYAPPEEGVVIELKLPLNAQMDFFALDRSYGLPLNGNPPRPPELMPKPRRDSDTVAVVTRARIN